jgi:tetratricopeptide (TPR) repeat protein
MLRVDVLDIVAIILGVLFTIRKLDAQRRTPQEFSHVEPLAFNVWQRKEVSVYGAAMFASFGKVFADWGFLYFFAEGLPFRTTVAVGATIDISWILVMVLTVVRSRQLLKLRTLHRIILGGFVVESNDELSTELSEAIRTLKDGDVDRAAYQLKQIALDADDRLRALSLYYLGECYLRQEKNEEARDAFVESLEMDPTLRAPQEALARISLKRDEA